MLCLLKHHRGLTLSLFSVFAVLFLSLFGFVSPSFATSQSITVDSTNYTSNQYFYVGSSVNSSISSLLSFKPAYVEVSFSSNINWNSCGSNQYGILSYAESNSSVVTYNVAQILCFNTAYSYSVSLGSRLDSANSVLLYRSGQVNSAFSNNSDFSITYIFYDSVPTCDCPEPDPCPEIPDDSQTLLDIKYAIFCIPATLLVLYFFYIMFGWYLGVRR